MRNLKKHRLETPFQNLRCLDLTISIRLSAESLRRGARGPLLAFHFHNTPLFEGPPFSIKNPQDNFRLHRQIDTLQNVDWGGEISL